MSSLGSLEEVLGCQRREKLIDAPMLAFKIAEGTTSQGDQRPLEAGNGKNKKKFSPPESSEGEALQEP
jgi:hypothetical protein